MPKDLRSFIAELEAKYPGEIARVTKPISPRYEITALLTQLEKAKRFPLLYCEKVDGSDAPVVINAQASRKLMALALECKPEELAAKFTERQGKPIAPVEVHDKAAPVQEVVKLGDDIDLSKVPLLTHYDVNAAPYVTAGIVVATDPDTGVRNTSYNRLMMAGQARAAHLHGDRPPFMDAAQQDGAAQRGPAHRHRRRRPSALFTGRASVHTVNRR